MSVLTTSQLTFCDLKDSYNIHIDTEYVGLTCDNGGNVVSAKDVTITYYASVGAVRVGASCSVSNLPSGVSLVSKTDSSASANGSIVLRVANKSTLNNNFTSSAKITFTTQDSEQFTFEKYITFVKSIAGADGTDAVNFQIYSVDGFEFGGSLTSISLKTAAFQGGNVIKSGATYQWARWDNESNEYEDIPGATSSVLDVSVDDQYAQSSLKCKMTYGNIVYEDYVSLTEKVDVYTAIVKFLDGNNIIANDRDYVIAYVELYNNNNIEEPLYSNNIYISDTNSLNGSVISTNIEGSYTDNDLVYFVCKNTSNNTTEYNVVLGKYSSNSWTAVSNKYMYKNDLFSSTTSQIIFVPKEKITRTLNINFEVSHNSYVIARTSAMVFDMNDPVIGETQPSNPKNGQLWLDTSASSSILKMWNGAEWVISNYQNGNVVYTSRPDSYSAGDLWILSDAEECGDFCPGSMLKASVSSNTFNSSHWVDVDAEATAQRKNIKQYFSFTSDTGLRIGQSDNKFYVNISSTRMGFCDNPDVQTSSGTEVIDPNEVVGISNRSATIKNLTVKDGAAFDCEVKFGNFMFKTENNGSLSLALPT